MRRIAIIGLLCCISSLSLAQWKDTSLEDFSKAILASESKISQNSSYSFETTFLFFEQVNAESPALTYTGLIASDEGKELYIEQFDRQTVQDKEINVTYDSLRGMLILQNPDSTLVTRRTLESFNLFLNSQCTVKKQAIGKSTAYYVAFASGARYKAAEIHFMENGLVERYILYAAEEIVDDTKEEGNQLIQPRLEIHYKNYQFGKNAISKNRRHVTDFVTKENGIYTAKPQYRTLEFINLRTPNNN